MMDPSRAALPFHRVEGPRDHYVDSPPFSSALFSHDSSGSSSATTTPSSQASSASSSILSQLERLVMEDCMDSDGSAASTTCDELPLLWSAVSQTARVQASCEHASVSLLRNKHFPVNTATTTAPSSSLPGGSAKSAARCSPPHAQFVREVTGLLWGADYPSWMEAQWMRLGEMEEEDNDDDDDENDEVEDECDDVEVVDPAQRSPSLPPSPKDAAAEANANLTAHTLLQDLHNTAERDTALQHTRTGVEEAATKLEKDTGRAATTTVTTQEDVDEEMSQQQQEQSGSNGCVFLLQQALEALQLPLPLHEAPPSNPPEPSPTSPSPGKRRRRPPRPRESAVAALSRHVLRDAPLLWLRYLLVPMLSQWTQQQRQQQQGQPVDVRGAATMQRLVDALSTAALAEALRREAALVEEVQEQVRRLPPVVNTETQSPAAEAFAARKLSDARSSLQSIRQRQRQHTAELLCFAGTLASTTQSFSVLSSGGLTLLTALLLRLVGDVRASWAEWRRTHTAAQLSRTGPLRALFIDVVDTAPHQRSTAEVSDDENDGQFRTRTAKGRRHDSHEASEGSHHHAHARKRSRDNDDAKDDASSPQSVQATLAALRRVLAASARQHARLLWRCWSVLFGFYGADLYTDEGVARALAEEEEADAGVSRMSAEKQAQWRRLRRQASVKQHALSETHWLVCRTLLTSVEAATRDVDSAEQLREGSTAVLYRRVVTAAMRTFFNELRDTLRLYATAFLALRSGVLASTAATASAALAATVHNTAALQSVFHDFLSASLGAATTTDTADDDAVRTTSEVTPAALSSPFLEQAGAYVWHLCPTLLRTQAPEEASWMSSGGGGSGGHNTHTAIEHGAVGDEDEAAAALFAEAYATHWRRRAADLTSMLADTSTRMENLLTHADELARAASVHGVTLTSEEKDSDDGCGGYGRMVQLLSDAVFESAAKDVEAVSTGGGTDALSSIATMFPAVFDASCFFVLLPERQRLFTRAMQRLCALVKDSCSGDGRFVSAIQRDTRLWMLLAHGVLLLCERRGRMAEEEEALLVTGLLPLLSVMRTSGVYADTCTTHNNTNTRPEAEEEEEETTEGKKDEEETWMTWADMRSSQDMLLLLASGLLALPWSVEELHLTVGRHTELCALYGHAVPRASHVPQPAPAREALRRGVAFMSRWFTNASGERGGKTTSSASGSAAALSMWDFTDAPQPSQRATTTAAAFGGSSPAALAQVCAQVDRHTRLRDPFLRRAMPSSSLASMGDSSEIGEDAEETHLAAALDRHGRVAGAFVSSAPCGLLIVVGAYRSMSRALYQLRAAMEEQYRVAREDGNRDYLGRSATFCTSQDVNTLRAMLTVVHRVVFADCVQPHGLLRLWLGYLQHLFLCVVPQPSSSLVGSGSGEGEGEDRLVLMPASWQHRHRVATLFGARVYRSGWRALQRDGVAASHTRLREVVGESLAELLLLPYTTPVASSSSNNSNDEDDEDLAAAPHSPGSTAATLVLQHTLPHAVLDILCELLSIPIDAEDAPRSNTSKSNKDASRKSAMTTEESIGQGVHESFLGLSGLIAFLRRLELLVVPGSLRDRRLESVLRRVYDAADAAALGV